VGASRRDDANVIGFINVRCTVCGC
jgi:hypothetical protein